MAATQSPKQSQQAGPAARKLRILFIAEAVTLAHVARPAVLAMALDKSQYDITFAVDPRYKALFPELADVHHDLWSIDSELFLQQQALCAPAADDQSTQS